jgi:hypothetical protein
MAGNVGKIFRFFRFFHPADNGRFFPSPATINARLQMTNDAPDAQQARNRLLAAGLRGGDLFDQLVRISVVYAHADPELRDAKLSEMADFVKTAARIQGEDNGVRFNETDLSEIAGAVEADARDFLAFMPLDGGRA